MNRDDAPSTFSQAWAQLTGYVTEARDDGDGLDPAQLLSYMTELRGEVLATALTEAFPAAPVGGQEEPRAGNGVFGPDGEPQPTDYRAPVGGQAEPCVDGVPGRADCGAVR